MAAAGAASSAPGGGAALRSGGRLVGRQRAASAGLVYPPRRRRRRQFRQSRQAGRAAGAFFGAGDTGTGFLTGAALAAGCGPCCRRGGARRAGVFRPLLATGLAAAGFLALADLGAGRLAAISRSSKAVWLVKDAGLYRPTFACKRGGKCLQNQGHRTLPAGPEGLDLGALRARVRTRVTAA